MKSTRDVKSAPNIPNVLPLPPVPFRRGVREIYVDGEDGSQQLRFLAVLEMSGNEFILENFESCVEAAICRDNALRAAVKKGIFRKEEAEYNFDEWKEDRELTKEIGARKRFAKRQASSTPTK